MSESRLVKALVVPAAVAVAGLLLTGCGARDDASTGSTAASCVDTSKDTIKVGSLHSLSGTMAISEVTVANSTKLAIDQINAAGGVLGKKIEIVLEDGASDPDLRREGREADQLRLCRFGIRRLDLIEPQGHEAQVREPELAALLPRAVRGSGRFEEHLLHRRHHQSADHPGAGLPEAEGHQVPLPGRLRLRLPADRQREIKAYAAANGIEIKGEDYTPLGSTDFSTIVNKVRAAKAGAVFNTLNGDSNVAFFREYTNAGLKAAEMPVFRCPSPRKRSRVSARRTSPAS